MFNFRHEDYGWLIVSVALGAPEKKVGYAAKCERCGGITSGLCEREHLFASALPVFVGSHTECHDNRN